MFFKIHYKGASKKVEGISQNLAQVPLEILIKKTRYFDLNFFFLTFAFEILKANVSIRLCFLGDISAKKPSKIKKAELKVPTKA